MSTIHEIAAVTSKGQVTLPKAIRQLLDVSSGEKVVFDLVGTQVVVSKLGQPEQHSDPAIAAFLQLLENDIQAGQVADLPPGLQEAMRVNLQHEVDLDDDIVGEVDC